MRIPWRPAAYLLSGGLTGAAAFTVMLLLAASGTALAPVLVGLPLLAALALSGVPYAAVERRRLRLLDPEPVADPHRDPDRTGITAWARTRFGERATWQELGYAVLAATVLWPLELLAVGGAFAVPADLLVTPLLLAADGGQANPLKLHAVTGYPAALACAAAGLLLLPAFLYALGPVAGARAALARWLLTAGATAELAARVTELTTSRARLAAAFDAERRRIERDLHDGAQQRLVALSMTLGLARLDAPAGSPIAAQLAKAHAEAGQVLASLRELINGIHPQVLTDRGLPDALADAADRSPIPVRTQVSLPARLPEEAESAAYFVVCEALANAAKHSGASGVTVTGGHDGSRLTVEVRDDGRGGADAARGTGLTGLADRVAVVDGTLTLASPTGGPTLLRVEIPCTLRTLRSE
jgi:signal transduction histidine kinase